MKRNMKKLVLALLLTVMSGAAFADKMPVKEFFALCAEGNLEEVERALAEDRADVNEPNEKGETALMIAAFNGRYEVAEALVRAGADVRKMVKWSRDDSGIIGNRTALHYACNGSGDPRIVELLIGFGADPNGSDRFNEPQDKLTPLSLAVSKGHCEAVNALIKAGAGVNLIGDRHDIMAKTESGVTVFAPICYGAMGGAEVTRILLDAGAKVAKNALLYLTADNAEVAEILINAGADVNNEEWGDGITPILFAVHKGYVNVIDVLVEYGADVKAVDKHGHNALWYLQQNKDLSPEVKKACSDKLFALMRK